MDSLTRNIIIHRPEVNIKRKRQVVSRPEELEETLAWFEQMINEARNSVRDATQLVKITSLKPQSLICCIYVSKIIDLELDLNQLATINLSSSNSLLQDTVCSITRQLTGTSSPYLDHLNKWFEDGNINIVINNIEAYGSKTLEKLLQLGNYVFL
jgi:hypothetical protein